MKPFHLIILPFVALMILGIVWANIWTWHVTCGNAMNCNTTFQSIALGGPLFDLLTGNWGGFGNYMASPDLSGISAIASFFIGIILLIIGLGLQIGVSGSVLGTGASASLGSASQGTKLAQILGFDLLIWGLTTSLTTIDGVNFFTEVDLLVVGLGTLLFLALQLINVSGVIWQSQSYM